ncbi:MAG: methionine synthase, partial [Phycisphaerales bacterium]|nr:methionine synthase [Phycisphaerales bacterium]
ASWAAALNEQAAAIAREAAGPDRFVLGSIGPGTRLVSLGQTTWRQMLASYREQADGLLSGGVDAFMIETAQDLLQVKCAINACLDAIADRGGEVTDVPVLVNVTLETNGAMLLGSTLPAILAALRPFPIASLGLNCGTGPFEMSDAVAWLSRHWDRPISVVPNAGIPELRDGQAVFPLGPMEFAVAMQRFVENHGVQVTGGCCGTTPAHIAALREVIDGTTCSSREVTPPPAACSSLYSAVDFRQDTSLLLVAERTNANGSRKFRRLLEEEDREGLLGMAREELTGGAHILDLCVDLVGRDGAVDMSAIAAKIAAGAEAPLMLDSTEAATIEAGLQVAGGRCVVNSLNLEDGERRFDEICPLLRQYGAACVALTIDERGMARDAESKLEVAKRMRDLFVDTWGLDEHDLLIDPLTFTIATGVEDDRKLGLETLLAIELLAAELPNCGIILGLSNISFGLRPPARRVLNSAFLDESVRRGLTAAILHASKILPRDRVPPAQWEAAVWLIFDRRGEDRPEGMPEDFDPLLHFISLFEGASEEPEVEMTDMSLDERLQWHIISGMQDGLEQTLDLAMVSQPPLAIINDHLLAAMAVVGKRFGSGRMQLPFVLQSAEVMKRAVTFLESHIEGEEMSNRGRIVLATVAGDVHDIGKNLVDIILSNNGFEVVNLGIRQPISAIVDAAGECEADAIGMSGLLVKSVAVMQENLKSLNERGIDIPVLLGGAALSRHWTESTLRDIYRGPVYYGRDAFEGLRICDCIARNDLSTIDSEIDKRLTKRAEVERTVAAARTERASRAVSAPTPRPIEAVAIPEPPCLGARCEDGVPLDDIYSYINTTALFRGQWGFRRGGLAPNEYAAMLRDTVEPLFERMKSECSEGILQPAVAWGWWKCARDGDEIVIFSPENEEHEVERFSFPRQTSRARRCISDYFRSIDDAQRDVIGFSCVTMGAEVGRRARTLFEDDRYSEYLYLHGMGVECAEALAEYWHARMRAEIGIDGDDKSTMKEIIAQGYRGSRYSFGYPACPQMSDQTKLFGLLRPDRIGCTLTENYEIVPEQSTSALIVHHPRARYFNANT